MTQTATYHAMHLRGKKKGTFRWQVDELILFLQYYTQTDCFSYSTSNSKAMGMQGEAHALL